jgi:hypothetical protein
MALIYHTNLKNLFAGSMLRALGGEIPRSNSLGPYGIGMTIYSGTPPATADIVAASWATYNSTTSNYLAHFVNAEWSMPAYGPMLSISTYPAPVTPINNGTATWAILWAGRPSALQLSSNTLPYTNFLTVSVSDPIGDGVLRFLSTSFTTSATVSVQDGTMATSI